MHKHEPRTALVDVEAALRCTVQVARSEAALWLQRARTRRQLQELEPRILADIGRTRAECRREAAKWFWQP